MISISDLNGYPWWIKLCGIILLLFIVAYIALLVFYPKQEIKENKSDIAQQTENKNIQKQPQITWVKSDENLKHKIIYNDELDFKVDAIPYCVTHDLQLIDYGKEYVCVKQNCKTLIPKYLKTKLHDTAISLAEKRMREIFKS